MSKCTVAVIVVLMLCTYFQLSHTKAIAKQHKCLKLGETFEELMKYTQHAIQKFEIIMDSSAFPQDFQRKGSVLNCPIDDKFSEFKLSNMNINQRIEAQIHFIKFFHTAVTNATNKSPENADQKSIVLEMEKVRMKLYIMEMELKYFQKEFFYCFGGKYQNPIQFENLNKIFQSYPALQSKQCGKNSIGKQESIIMNQLKTVNQRFLLDLMAIGKYW